MNAAHMFVRALENEGVQYVFGIPGEENLDLLEALRTSGIRLILTRHEQAAGFMAATVGRLTGRPGVCLSTLGPGATNLVTAASYALLGGWPALFITGQKPITKSKQGRFQIINVVRMMEPVTKHSRQIVHAHNVPGLVRESCRIAMEEKPGPVHLELPEDIAAQESDTGAPFAVTTPHAPNPSSTAIDRAVEILRTATRPMFVIAAGADRRDVGRELYNLLYKTGIYFCTTQMGKGVVDERHPHCLGTAALSDSDYLHCALNSADVIVNVGHDVVEKPPFFMHPGVEVIHLAQTPAPIDDVYWPQHEVVGDMAVTVREITARLGQCPNMDSAYFERVKKEIEANVYECCLAETVPLRPQRVVSIVRDALPESGVLSLDNGMYKIWFARNFRAYEAKTVLLDNALASMGAGLPVAIAARLLQPERKVVAVCGDGGFMMNSQEMETAVRLGLDLVVVVLRDDGFGMIKWKQGGMGLPDYGLDFGNPDFVAYAESYGAEGHRVEKPGDLAALLRQSLDRPGVHLIDVPVDYSENQRVFLEELKKKTCVL